MPPKMSKKNTLEKKSQKVEDRTFGLKNKNKSQKVKAYVQEAQAQSKEIGTKKDRDAQANANAQKKADVARAAKDKAENVCVRSRLGCNR